MLADEAHHCLEAQVAQAPAASPGTVLLQVRRVHGVASQPTPLLHLRAAGEVKELV